MTIVRSNPDPLPNKVKEAIRAVEEQRQSCLFLLISGEAIDRSLVNLCDKVCRQTIAEVSKVDILIQSGGGDINATYKLVNLFRDYEIKVSALIPGYAKSAATFFVLEHKKF
jgi:ATP-dependent protease ClpP protease subunit